MEKKVDSDGYQADDLFDKVSGSVLIWSYCVPVVRTPTLHCIHLANGMALLIHNSRHVNPFSLLKVSIKHE